MKRPTALAASSASAAQAAALGLAVALGGCQSIGSPGPGSPSYREGQLGNGGFAFECDDSVACDRFTNTAKTFPDAIALGSTFRVRYIPKDADVKGVTVGSVGSTFVTHAATGGLAATKAGYATITAVNGTGSLVEFVTVPVRAPDALVVYDAAYKGTSPSRITSLTLAVGAGKSLRALARAKQADLAGTLAYEWTASASDVVDVRAEASGKVTLTGLVPGKARVSVVGGTFTQELDVEVTP